LVGAKAILFAMKDDNLSQSTNKELLQQQTRYRVSFQVYPCLHYRCWYSHSQCMCHTTSNVPKFSETVSKRTVLSGTRTGCIQGHEEKRWIFQEANKKKIVQIMPCVEVKQTLLVFYIVGKSWYSWDSANGKASAKPRMFSSSSALYPYNSLDIKYPNTNTRPKLCCVSAKNKLSIICGVCKSRCRVEAHRGTRMTFPAVVQDPKSYSAVRIFPKRYFSGIRTSTSFLFGSIFLKRYERNELFAELLTKQAKKSRIGWWIQRNEKCSFRRKTTDFIFQRNRIEMRKGTGGYERLSKPSIPESPKEQQPERKSSNNKKKTTSASEGQSELQYRRRIVSYGEDGSVLFERDLQPGEDFSVALEEWNEERSNLGDTVVEAMNPELDWVQNDVEEEKVSVSKRIPKWIADDVDLDDSEEEEEDETTTDEMFSEEEEVV
jgi:hypothetical protein